MNWLAFGWSLTICGVIMGLWAAVVINGMTCDDKWEYRHIARGGVVLLFLSLLSMCVLMGYSLQ